MAKDDFVVWPIDRKRARQVVLGHPHAPLLPNSSKYYLELRINRQTAGLAVWGYGITPTKTAGKLFHSNSLQTHEYLELCRFFVHDWVPKNTPSRFLATTHRLIRKHAPEVKVLYTYAAAFSGLLGYIYKASGYDYIGKQLCDCFLLIPNVGLVHAISQWHRFGKQGIKHMHRIFPGVKKWVGYNFRYLYWNCDTKEKQRLMQYANFKKQPFPTESEMEVWTIDINGNKEMVPLHIAKQTNIVKLNTRRKHSTDAAAYQLAEGGVIPTPALHNS